MNEFTPKVHPARGNTCGEELVGALVKLLKNGVKVFEVFGELLSINSDGRATFLQAISHGKSRIRSTDDADYHHYHAVRVILLKTLPYMTDKTFARELGTALLKLPAGEKTIKAIIDEQGWST